jgi:hypothetical protein
MLDQAVAALDRFTRNHRIAVGIDRRARQDVAVLVAVELEQLGRK